MVKLYPPVGSIKPEYNGKSAEAGVFVSEKDIPDMVAEGWSEFKPKKTQPKAVPKKKRGVASKKTSREATTITSGEVGSLDDAMGVKE